MRILSPRFAAALAVLAPFLPEAAAGRVSELEVRGRATTLRFADADGDGDRDAFVYFVDDAPRDPAAPPSPQRGIALHRRDAGGLARLPALVFAAPEDALYADVADLDGDGKATVLLVRGGGLDELDFSGDEVRATRLLEQASFFRRAESAALPALEVALDADGDGRRDVLLPGTAGHVLFRNSEGGLGAGITLGSGGRHDVEAAENAYLLARAALPRPSVLDWDGDGRRDLLFAASGRVDRWRPVAAKDGAPGAGAVERVLDLAALALGAEDLSGFVLTAATLADADGDGRADLFVTRRLARPSLASAVTTRTLVFLADDLARPDGRPRQAIRSDGIATRPVLADLDGDGARDLVLAVVKAGAASKLQEALLDRGRVEHLVYRFEPKERRFADPPIARVERIVDAERLTAMGAVADVTFTADFDGDGRADCAVYDARARLLTIRRSVADEGFFSSTPIEIEERPWFRLEIDLPGGIDADETDGDGRPELISSGPGRVVVVEPHR